MIIAQKKKKLINHQQHKFSLRIAELTSCLLLRTYKAKLHAFSSHWQKNFWTNESGNSTKCVYKEETCKCLQLYRKKLSMKYYQMYRIFFKFHVLLFQGNGHSWLIFEHSHSEMILYYIIFQITMQCNGKILIYFIHTK